MGQSPISIAIRAAGIGSAVAIGGGVLIGFFMGSAVAWINDVSSFSEIAILVGTLCALYVAVSLPVVVGATVPISLLGIRPTLRISIAIFVAFYVLVNAATRFISSVQFISVLPHMSTIGLIDVLVILIATLAAAWGIWTSRTLKGLGITALLLGGLHVIHHYHERPRLIDVSEWVASTGASGPTKSVFGTAPTEEQFKNTKIAVLGIDGLGWEVLVPLLKSGDLPNFQTLLAGSAAGHLETNFYTRSPALWESISTGKDPFGSGISDHYHYDFPGIERRIAHFPRIPMNNSWFGINRLLAATMKYGTWSMVFADALDAKAARFWEIAEREGYRAGIYEWYNTTPVAPMKGFMSGRGYTNPRHFPLDLEEGMTRLKKAPLQLGTPWVEAQSLVEIEHFKRFIDHAQKFEPSLLAYYTHFADGVNHMNWKHAAHGSKYFIGGLWTEDLKPSPAIIMVMRFLDGQLGEVMRRLPEDATLVIVSDHGWDFRGYEHDNAPPGVVIVRGPDVAPGIVNGYALIDVAPTILHLLGIAVGQDMQGRPMDIARPGSALDREPRFIASHGAPAAPIDLEQIVTEDAKQHEDYLRALGYVQ